jgi:hypothetical protein
MLSRRNMKINTTESRMGQKARQYAAVIFAVAGMNHHARASEAPAPIESGGISIQAQRLKDSISFCVRSDGEHKVSSEFGIEFKVERGDAGSWRDKLPKIITGPGYYFSLPKEVELATRKDPGGQTMHVELGACSAKENRCDRLEFSIPVPKDKQELAAKCE